MNIAVIGAGLSGTMFLVNLAKLVDKQNFNFTVFLVEAKTNHIARGIAYSSDLPYQPLNVIAQKMNFSSDSPNDFLEWLHSNNYNFQPNSFVSRHIFGDFLTDQLNNAKQILADRLLIINDKAINIFKNKTLQNIPFYQIEFGNSPTVNADLLILAVGADTPAVVADASTRIFNNPYQQNIFNQIADNQRVMIIGNGLTMVDWAISLYQKTAPTVIYCISRRGQLPKSHYLQSERWTIEPEQIAEIQTVKQFYNHFQQNIIAAFEQKKLAWQSVLDAYRPHLPQIWDSFDQNNKQLFLRFLRPYWESARFRCTEESGRILEHLQKQSSLTAFTGKIENIELIENQELTPFLKVNFYNKISKQTQTVEVDYLINCTGAADFRKKMPLLFQNLVKNKLAQVDSLNIGLQTDKNGCLIAENTEFLLPIYTLGAVRKAKEWETLSIQSIRTQAEKLAQLVYNQLLTANFN